MHICNLVNQVLKYSTTVISQSNNIQLIKNCFVAVSSILSHSCDTGTSSSVVIQITSSMYSTYSISNI